MCMNKTSYIPLYHIISPLVNQWFLARPMTGGLAFGVSGTVGACARECGHASGQTAPVDGDVDLTNEIYNIGFSLTKMMTVFTKLKFTAYVHKCP